LHSLCTKRNAHCAKRNAQYDLPNSSKNAERFHIVRRGETLSDISYKYYGSADKWQKILDANRKMIKDVNKPKPDVKLIIPE